MNILTVVQMKDEYIEKITSAAEGHELVFAEKPSREQVENADIIFGNVAPDLLKNCTKLKWLQTNSAGVNEYMVPGALPEGCQLTNATGSYGLAISEYMVGVYLELIKKLNLYRDNQHKNKWEDLGPVKSIYGSTVLVMGLGDIGGEFAKRCKALGAYVIGLRRKDTTPADYADEIHLTAEVDELLLRADCVAIAMPGTAETKGMINAERIAKMKDGAVLINVGRGFIVETEALCDALESGKLSGAAVDVTDPEPLPADHRLWNIPTAVVTPHISGQYHLEETRRRIVGIFTSNLERFLKGEELKNIVDFATGYRKL